MSFGQSRAISFSLGFAHRILSAVPWIREIEIQLKVLVEDRVYVVSSLALERVEGLPVDPDVRLAIRRDSCIEYVDCHHLVVKQMKSVNRRSLPPSVDGDDGNRN